MDSSLQETSSTQQPTWQPVRAGNGRSYAAPSSDVPTRPSSPVNSDFRNEESEAQQPIATSQIHESWSLQAGNSLEWKVTPANGENEDSQSACDGLQQRQARRPSTEVEETEPQAVDEGGVDERMADDIDREWMAMESSEPAEAVDGLRDIDVEPGHSDSQAVNDGRNVPSLRGHAEDGEDKDNGDGNDDQEGVTFPAKSPMVTTSNTRPTSVSSDISPPKQKVANSSNSPKTPRPSSPLSDIDEVSHSSPKRDSEPGPYIESPKESSPSRSAPAITPRKTRSTTSRPTSIKRTAASLKSPHQPISAFSPSKALFTATNRVSRQASAPAQAVHSPLKRDRTFERAHSSRDVDIREQESFGGDASLKPRQRLELLAGTSRQTSKRTQGKAGVERQQVTAAAGDEDSGTDTEEPKVTSVVGQSSLDIPQEAELLPKLTPIPEVRSSQMLEPTYQSSSPSRKGLLGLLSMHRYDDDDPMDPASPTPVRRSLTPQEGSDDEPNDQSVLFSDPRRPFEVRLGALPSSAASSQPVGLSQLFGGSEKAFGEDDSSQQEYSMAATQAVRRTASSRASSPELPQPQPTYVPPPMAVPSVSIVSSNDSPTVSTNPRVSASRQLGRSRPRSGASGQFDPPSRPSHVHLSTHIPSETTVSSTGSRPGTRSSNIPPTRRLSRAVRSENSLTPAARLPRMGASGVRRTVAPVNAGPIPIAVIPGIEATQIASISDGATQQQSSHSHPVATYIDSPVAAENMGQIPESSPPNNLPTDTLINPSSSAPAVLVESCSPALNLSGNRVPGSPPLSMSPLLRDQRDLQEAAYPSGVNGTHVEISLSRDRPKETAAAISPDPSPPQEMPIGDTPIPVARKLTENPPSITSVKVPILSPLTPSSSRSVSIRTPLRRSGSRRSQALAPVPSPIVTAGMGPDQPTSPVQLEPADIEAGRAPSSPSLEIVKPVTPAKHRYGQPKSAGRSGTRERKPTAKVREAQEQEAAKRTKGKSRKNVTTASGKKPQPLPDARSEEEWDSGSTQLDPRDESFRPHIESKAPRTSKRKRIVESPEDPSEEANTENEVENKAGDVDEDVSMADSPVKEKRSTKGKQKAAKPKVTSTSNGKRPRASKEADSDLGSSPLTTYESGDETYHPTHLAVRVTKTGRGDGRSTRASSVSTNGKNSMKRRKLDAAKSKRKSTDSGNGDAGPSRLSITALPPGPSNLSSPLSSAPVTRLPLQVLCYWITERRYYVGKVDEQVNDKFSVKFLDGYETVVSIDRLRLLELRKDDIVRCNSKTFPQGDCRLVEDYAGDERGIKVETEQEEVRFIPLDLVWVSVNIVKRDWNDRLVEPRHLGLASYAGLERNAAPKLSQVFVGQTFLITANAPKAAEVDVRKQLGDTIQKQGGTVVKDYLDLLAQPENSFGSALSTENVPFLLVHEQNSKPKLLAALAAGIPCLSSNYVADAIDRIVDWRAYLVSPGFSVSLGQWTSQVIDPSWGGLNWDITAARNPRQIFLGKTFLFVLPHTVPEKLKPVRALVPFCLHALGASSMEHIPTPIAGKDLSGYDYVLVETRTTKGKVPHQWEQTGKVCDFDWFKQCIITGGALPPAVLGTT